MLPPGHVAVVCRWARTVPLLVCSFRTCSCGLQMGKNCFTSGMFPPGHVAPVAAGQELFRQWYASSRTCNCGLQVGKDRFVSGMLPPGHVAPVADGQELFRQRHASSYSVYPIQYSLHSLQPDLYTGSSTDPIKPMVFRSICPSIGRSEFYAKG
jgi:hypothetical protein